jgi:hypothetical protein
MGARHGRIDASILFFLSVVSLLTGNVSQSSGLSIKQFFCSKEKNTLFTYDVMPATIINKRPPSCPESNHARLLLDIFIFS